jgi:hypothetical protein
MLRLWVAAWIVLVLPCSGAATPGNGWGASITATLCGRTALRVEFLLKTDSGYHKDECMPRVR